MSKRCITTRFYTDEPVGRNAWDKVQARQKRDRISCSQAIVALLNEHGESILSDEQLADMTHRITECVMDELQRTLPSFIAGCVAGAAQSAQAMQSNPSAAPVAAPPKQSAFPDLSDIPAPDFSQGPIDLGFIGGCP